MLKKFIVESIIPGIGQSSRSELGQMAEKVNETIDRISGSIQWSKSIVTTDRIFSIFIAENEEIIREFGRQSGISIESIETLKLIIDPADAQQADIPYDSGTNSSTSYVI